MTTRALADERNPRRPSDGRFGAIAAVTPVEMYLLWNAIVGWGGDASQFVLASAQIALGAVVAGWIVGGHIGHSIPACLRGLVAYGFIAYLVLMPINIIGSIWGDLQAGRVSDVLEVVAAAAEYLLYGLVSAIYTSVFLLPFGAGWLVTFLILRRAFAP